MSDEEIVGLVQKGDKEKYGEIVGRYEGKLFGYIKRLCNQSNEEVEDLLQEVFISGFVNIQAFDCRKKFSSWIYRIAHNKVIGYFRYHNKKNKGRSVDDMEEYLKNGEEKLIEEVMIEKEERDRINKAIRKLKENHREVLVLFYFEEKSYEEISDILQIPVNNVGVLIYRAKEKLKEQIKHE